MPVLAPFLAPNELSAATSTGFGGQLDFFMHDRRAEVILITHYIDIGIIVLSDKQYFLSLVG